MPVTQRIHLCRQSADRRAHFARDTDAQQAVKLHQRPGKIVSPGRRIEQAQIWKGLEVPARQGFQVFQRAAQAGLHLPTMLLQLTRRDQRITRIVPAAEIEDERARLRIQQAHFTGDATARLLHEISGADAASESTLLDFLHLLASHEHVMGPQFALL